MDPNLADDDTDANNPSQHDVRQVSPGRAALAEWQRTRKRGESPTVAAAASQIRATRADMRPAPRATTAERKSAGRKKKKTAKERRDAARELQRARNARKDAARTKEMETWIETTEDVWCPPGVEPERVQLVSGQALPVVPAELQTTMGAIVADPSGACIRHWFSTCPLKAFAGLVRKVALVPIGGGQWFYTWGDLHARQTVAFAALAVGMMEPTQRNDHWCYELTGLTRIFIGWLLRDPHTGTHVSHNLLTGTWGRGGNWRSTSFERGNRPGRGCGIVRALRDVGAVTVPPNYMLPPRYGVDGHQPNAYWLLGDMMRSYRVAELMDLAQWEQVIEAGETEGPPSIYEHGPPA